MHVHIYYTLHTHSHTRFNAKASSFEDIPSTPITHHTLTSHTKNTPLILDTPTRVFLWLPSSYWEREEEHQKTVLEIAEVFTHLSSVCLSVHLAIRLPISPLSDCPSMYPLSANYL